MGKNEVLIQPAILSDASAILDLQKLAYQSEAAIYDDYAIPPLTQTPESMEFDLCMKTVLKATLDKKIIGSIRGFLAEGTCHIGRLIVDPAFQNRGIGTRLMQALEQHFASAERYELFTGDKSERNLYLYKKLGYKLIRTEKASDRVTHVFLEKRRPQ
jgi:ribosomal protein S18 acetylase RimI-like enzyme